MIPLKSLPRLVYLRLGHVRLGKVRIAPESVKRMYVSLG